MVRLAHTRNFKNSLHFIALLRTIPTVWDTHNRQIPNNRPTILSKLLLHDQIHDTPTIRNKCSLGTPHVRRWFKGIICELCVAHQ